MSVYVPHMTPMVLSEGGEAMTNATTGNHCKRIQPPAFRSDF